MTMAKTTTKKSRTTKNKAKGATKRNRKAETNLTTPNYCSAPIIPPREFAADFDPNRRALIIENGNKWVNGTVIHYYFFSDGAWAGAEKQKKVVREAFNRWQAIGIGLEFREVQNRDEAEVRIGFKRNDGAWSYVGTYVLNIGQKLRTMNFGWDLTGADGMDTALHEIGHTLGLPHEHQNPNAGIVWNEEAVYAALAGPPNNWSRDKTYQNIISKLDPRTVHGSVWDPDSVMHYPFGKGLIDQPVHYRDGLTPAGGLSQQDVAWIQTFYPPLTPDTPSLLPFQSASLQLLPGQQADFRVTPTATRSYTFQTFGPTDTVMVLFERRGEEWRYVAGDDDSGEDYNARIESRLVAGRDYMLRIRLYWSNASGATSVMHW